MHLISDIFSVLLWWYDACFSIIKLFPYLNTQGNDIIDLKIKCMATCMDCLLVEQVGWPHKWQAFFLSSQKANTTWLYIFYVCKDSMYDVPMKWYAVIQCRDDVDLSSYESSVQIFLYLRLWSDISIVYKKNLSFILSLIHKLLCQISSLYAYQKTTQW